MKSRTIAKFQYDEFGSFLCKEYCKKNDLENKKHKTERLIREAMASNLPDLVKETLKKYPEYFDMHKFNLNNVLTLIDPNTIKFDKYKDNPQVNYGRLITQTNETYNKEIIEFANEMYKVFDEKDLNKYFSSNSENNISYPDKYSYIITYFGYGVKTDVYNLNFEGLDIPSEYIYDYYAGLNLVGQCLRNHPSIKEYLKEYIVEIGKYSKFRKDLSCAFSTITTTNMLKKEIPEAYEYFYNRWGAEYEKLEEKTNCKKKEKKAMCDTIEELRASIQ